ncbi:tetratricopeptide repeat protein [Bacteroides sp.]|uniref:tetratricopeptide repeat protein n=1 Tax=Bacteroides sp. TaxID=29523 RepID=UPI00260D05B2|nr:tetratricopeptide repeat protein [Bacteroides sp.]
MKNVLLFLFISLFTLYSHGQATQKGKVTLFNSGKQPLSGTEILVIGAPASDTDANGNFVLTLPKASPGQALVVTSIYKKGYELVNDQMLYSWIISEKRPMNIVMAPVGTINESKEKFYDVGLKQANMRLNQQQEKLNSLYRAGKMTLEQREEKLTSLKMEIASQKKAFEQCADYFARINPDEITKLEKQVLNYVKRGNIEQAITIYRQSQLLEQAIKQLNISIKESETVENYISILYRYANICMLAGDEKNRKKAEDIYKKIAEDNPDNYTYVNAYASFLLNTASKDVYLWCEKAVKLVSSDAELVQALFFLVCAYGGQSLLVENKTLMQKSYDRFSECIEDPNLQIAPIIREVYFLGRCTILPMLLYGAGDYEAAIKESKRALESIKSYEKQYGSDQTVSKESIYSNISLCYDAMKNWDLALKYNDAYYESLLSRTTNEEDRRVILFEYKTRMAEYAWWKDKDINKTISNAWEALEIGKNIKKVNYKTAGNFCSIYHILGASEQKKGNNEQALTFFLKGNEKEQSLVQTQLYGIYNYPSIIAIHYIRQKQYEEAASWNRKAMEIANYMENCNIETGASSIAMAYYTKGALAMLEKDTVTAKTCYEKVANLFTLYPNHHIGMESIYSYVFNKLSGIYYEEHNLVQALQVSREAQVLSLQKMEEFPQDIEKKFQHAYNCSYSGSIGLELKQSVEAIKNLKEAAREFKILVSYDEQVYLLYFLLNELNLSSAYYMNKNLKQAEEVLKNVSALAFDAAEKYSNDYTPIIFITQLYKGVLYEKTGRTQQGGLIVRKALEDLKAYSDNPMVTSMIGYYQAGEFYREKN